MPLTRLKEAPLTEVKNLQALAEQAMMLHAATMAVLGEHPKYTEAQVKLFEAATLLNSAADELKQHIAFSRVGLMSGPDQMHASGDTAKGSTNTS